MGVRTLLAMGFTLGLMLAGAHGQAGAPDAVLRGAGSTALAEIMKAATQQVILPLTEGTPQGSITYAATGSGKGLQLLLEGAVDFAIIDTAVNPVPGYLQMPFLLTTLSVFTNLPAPFEKANPQALRMTACTLARIFTGNITRWDDRALLPLNPWLAYQAAPINVCIREPDSGTAFIFMEYLKLACPSVWKGSFTSNATAYPTTQALAEALTTIDYTIGFADTPGASWGAKEILITGNPGKSLVVGKAKPQSLPLQYMGASQYTEYNTWLAKVSMPLPQCDGNWTQSNTIFLPGTNVFPTVHVGFAMYAQNWTGKGAVGSLGQTFFRDAVTTGQVYMQMFGYEQLPDPFQVRAFDGVNSMTVDPGYFYVILPRDGMVLSPQRHHSSHRRTSA